MYVGMHLFDVALHIALLFVLLSAQLCFALPSVICCASCF